MEPGGRYFADAMDELGVHDSNVQDIPPDGNVFRGKYPMLDSVYERAWELRIADEGE